MITRGHQFTATARILSCIEAFDTYVPTTRINLCPLTLRGSVSCHKGEHRLHRNIKTRNIEGFKHNFTSVFTALRGSEWTSRQKKVVILLITSQIIKYTMLHVVNNIGWRKMGKTRGCVRGMNVNRIMVGI